MKENNPDTTVILYIHQSFSLLKTY